MTPRTRIASIGAALFALNAAICWPLFRIEYLDALQSNEGSWMTIASFLRQHWPHVGWFPMSDGGMPFENTYLPAVGVLVALISSIAHCSEAHAFHLLTAAAYSFAPVSLFLFAFALSRRIAPSTFAALTWSLISPSNMFPDLLREMGTPWGLRRLRDIVYFGDVPHNVAICLLPIALLFIWRFLNQPTPRRFALAVFAAAAVMSTNAFGLVVVVLCSIILVAIQPSWKALASIGGIALTAYLLICRFLPPSLIKVMEKNSQTSGGDFRFTSRTAIYSSCFVILVLALWLATRRLGNPILQFAILFSTCFGGIVFLGTLGINLVPQGLRYHLELEPGICLTAVFLVAQLPWKPVVAVAVIPLLWLGIKDRQYALGLIHPIDIVQTLPFREARWIAGNLPGQRVFVSSEGQYLFNLFADNPQLGSGHEPSTPNWVQQVAIYTIYSGQNAGAEDGAISVLWLKAFGCGAIVVAGPTSKDHYHAVANPNKFEGILPLVWQDSGDSIYNVPQRSPSLAHVIPKSTVVMNRPINGLDVAELRTYVDALESPSAPSASIEWETPDHARIAASLTPSDVLSLQMNYDPGWEARVAGRRVNLSPDGLGFIQIDARCSKCSIDLQFSGGGERKLASVISAVVLLALIAAISLELFVVNRTAVADS